MNDVQALVDALAAELGRPIGVDDRHFRVIAFSSHQEGDRVRLISILRREAPDEVREWLESVGVHKAERVMRVPPNPELEMSARICFPLRFDRIPLGYLWMIDEPEPLSDAQLEEAAVYADELGVALYRARLLERDTRDRERELVAELIGRQEEARAAAAAALTDGKHLVQARSYGVMVLRAVGDDGDVWEVPDPVNLRMVDAAEQLRRAVAPRHLLVLVDGGDVVAVLACAMADELQRRAESLAELAASQLGEEAGYRALVGVGEEQPAPAGLSDAYAQACAAIRIATAVDVDGPVVRWSNLGAYRLLVGLLGEKDPSSLLPRSFQRLLEASDGETLAETLERYLDLGGDARVAAEALHLHRSSMYGRLHRIEEVAGVDLHSGEDRLELHLALRLWRLRRAPVR
jgi:sugar diacid utilization regulator